MYTYNKNDKSYTFSFDEVDIDKMVELSEDNNIKNDDINDNNHSENNTEYKKPHKKIEVINGGNDLDISPVSEYIEVEKQKNEKKESIVIAEDNK